MSAVVTDCHDFILAFERAVTSTTDAERFAQPCEPIAVSK